MGRTPAVVMCLLLFPLLLSLRRESTYCGSQMGGRPEEQYPDCVKTPKIWLNLMKKTWTDMRLGLLVGSIIKREMLRGT